MEKRSEELWGGGEEKDLHRDLPHAIALHWVIAEELQRSWSVQFVGSRNLTSSAQAGCEAASGTCHSVGRANQGRWMENTTVIFINGCRSSELRVWVHSLTIFHNKAGLSASTI